MKILEFNSIDLLIKKKAVLSKISFGVKENEIHCVLGRNGAGKTSLLKLVLGLLKPASGDIRFLDRSIEDRKLYNSVGSLINGVSLYDHLNVYENLLITALQRGITKYRINEVLDIIGLAMESKKKARDLSMGMRQRLGIGMAIIHTPRLLLLDEPTNGLDPEGVVQIRELLLLLNRSGVTILFTSHILDEVDRLANGVTLINNGTLIFSGSLSSFKEGMVNIETGYLTRVR